MKKIRAIEKIGVRQIDSMSLHGEVFCTILINGFRVGVRFSVSLIKFVMRVRLDG